MSDYIKRESVLELAWSGKIISNDNFKTVRELLQSIPAADVRPVIRCKECIFADTLNTINGSVWCSEHDRAMTEIDYCSRGAKWGAEMEYTEEA